MCVNGQGSTFDLLMLREHDGGHGGCALPKQRRDGGAHRGLEGASLAKHQRVRAMASQCSAVSSCSAAVAVRGVVLGSGQWSPPSHSLGSPPGIERCVWEATRGGGVALGFAGERGMVL